MISYKKIEGPSNHCSIRSTKPTPMQTSRTSHNVQTTKKERKPDYTGYWKIVWRAISLNKQKTLSQMKNK